MARKSDWFWVTLGVAASLLSVAVLVEAWYYKQRRGRDPRARQVRQLLHEAEALLVRGRKGVPDVRRSPSL